MPATSLPHVPVARDALVRVRVTPDEKRRLNALAAAQGRSVSELVRLHLPLSNVRAAAFCDPLTPATDMVVTGRDG